MPGQAQTWLKATRTVCPRSRYGPNLPGSATGWADQRRNRPRALRGGMTHYFTVSRTAIVGPNSTYAARKRLFSPGRCPGAAHQLSDGRRVRTGSGTARSLYHRGLRAPSASKSWRPFVPPVRSRMPNTSRSASGSSTNCEAFQSPTSLTHVWARRHLVLTHGAGWAQQTDTGNSFIHMRIVGDVVVAHCRVPSGVEGYPVLRLRLRREVLRRGIPGTPAKSSCVCGTRAQPHAG
jgi:hypothetical protein